MIDHIQEHPNKNYLFKKKFLINFVYFYIFYHKKIDLVYCVNYWNKIFFLFPWLQQKAVTHFSVFHDKFIFIYESKYMLYAEKH